jgi:DNA-binding CsgD family transcriptional regulator
VDESGKWSMERLSGRNAEHLISHLRETIYAHCDVDGFKARLVSAVLGPPEMDGRDVFGLHAFSHEKLGRFGLTRREAEILHLVAQGLTNKEIAATLHLSPLTIRTHLEHVYEKLGVGNRTEAAARVLKVSGLLEDNRNGLATRP